MLKSRNFTFTDYTLADWKFISLENPEIRYIIYGLESCPTTGRQHYQGWLQLKKAMEMKSVKSLIGITSLHLEIMRGNELQNQTYCRKDGKYVEIGEYKIQGARTDLVSLKRDIESGISMMEISDKYFTQYLRYHKGIEKYKTMIDQLNTTEFRKLKVVYIYGPTGTGKTKMAMSYATYKINGTELQWWDGYTGQEVICIDEYNNDVCITKMLNILDGYQLRLPIKGGFTYAKWKEVYITSNYTPQQLHPNAYEEHRLALFRRITEYVDMRSPDMIVDQITKLENKYKKIIENIEIPK